MISRILTFVHRRRLIFAAAAVAVAAVIAVAALAPREAVVCLDPGHGGSDVGAQNGARYEKDDNLALALAVRDALKEKGIKAVLTRKDDEFISLEKRCRFANRRKARLFVSLHRNSAETSSAAGIEAWIAASPSRAEKRLADRLLEELEGVGASKNRGVKKGIIGNSRGNYYVNANTKMTSCLLEVGFISNEGDNELFDESLDSYARAIADAIEANL